MNPPTIPMTPPTNFSAVATMRDELTKLLGGKAQMLTYMVKNKAAHMKDQFRIFGAELAKRGSSLTSSAPATAKPAAVPARQLIRLGATPPATPATPPKPPVHKFIPAPKPSAPAPVKPRAAGVRPDGSFNVVEAEARARQIFGSIPNMVSNANEASRWASLESVFRVNGFAPPWTGKVSKVDAQIAKLNGPLFARRAKLIATLFQS